MPRNPPGAEEAPGPKRRRMAERMAQLEPARVESIRQATNNLELVSGAPSTRKERERVTELWNEFTGVFGLQPETCPTGDHILSFLSAYIQLSEPGIIDREAISLSNVENTLATLVTILRFKYRDFDTRYTAHDSLRTHEFIEQCVRDGKVNRGRFWRRRWLGFQALHEMVETHVQNCLSGGVRDWDQQLIGILAFVLQYALSARVGDLTRSDCYTGNEFLAWKDVQLTLRDGYTSPPTVQDLKACVQLRFTKGQKQLDEDGPMHFFHSLQDLSQNFMCPIKLLLIMAMRTGQTYGTTIEDVLDHTRRTDGRVHWRSPERPVICAQNPSRLTEVNRPVDPNQLNALLKKMADGTGISDRVTTHAIRRGAIRDVGHLPQSTVNLTDSAIAAAVAGHSWRSLQSGVTDDYIGSRQVDFHNLRADQHLSRDQLAPRRGSRPFRRSLRHIDISRYMEDHGMDPQDQRARDRARHRLHRARLNSVEDDDDDEVEFVPRDSSEEEDSEEDLGEDPDSSSEEDSEEDLEEDLDENNTEPVVGQDPSQEQETDPATRVQALESLIFGGSDENTEVYIRPLRDRRTDSEDAGPTRLEANAFVNFFASINSIMYSTGQSGWPKILKNTGNSRAEPSLFIFHCNRGQCAYSTGAPKLLERHKRTCKGSAPATPDQVCNTCGQAFRSPVTLRLHIQDKHTDHIRKCKHCGQEFQTCQELAGHYVREHDSIDDGPILCPCANLQECPSPNREWSKWGPLRSHLREYHRLQDSQMEELLGPRILGKDLAGASGRWRCPATDCTHRYQTKGSLRTHLRTVHKLPQSELKSVLGTLTAEQPTTASSEQSGIEEHPMPAQVPPNVEVVAAIPTQGPQNSHTQVPPNVEVVAAIPTQAPRNSHIQVPQNPHTPPSEQSGTRHARTQIPLNVEVVVPITTQVPRNSHTQVPPNPHTTPSEQSGTRHAHTQIPPNVKVVVPITTEVPQISHTDEDSDEFGSEVDFDELDQVLSEDEEFGYTGELDQVISEDEDFGYTGELDQIL